MNTISRGYHCAACSCLIRDTTDHQAGYVQFAGNQRPACGPCRQRILAERTDTVRGYRDSDGALCLVACRATLEDILVRFKQAMLRLPLKCRKSYIIADGYLPTLTIFPNE